MALQSITRFMSRALAAAASVGMALALTAGNVQAAVEITSASWDGTTLTADGKADKPNKGGGPVELFDAATDGSLGLADLNNGGKWSYSGTTCADNIYATQDSATSAVFPVAGTPCPPGNRPPVANDDSATVTEGGQVTINVVANDFDHMMGTIEPTTVMIVQDVSNGSTVNNGDGTVTYTPAIASGTDSFTYTVEDNDGATSNEATVTITVNPVGGTGQEGPPDNAFVIPMNYELGMHCTGFEFAYCCVLPVYNSILAQVVKTEKNSATENSGKPILLEADPNVGLDGLGRPTVVRDLALDASGNFRKYMLSYEHHAQPRNDGRGKPQTSTLISDVEGKSLLAWNTTFDTAEKNAGGGIQTYDCAMRCTSDPARQLCATDSDCTTGSCEVDSYNGACGVMRGDGVIDAPPNPAAGDYGKDNYANAIWNHLYIYGTLEGTLPNGTPVGIGADNPTSQEADKVRLGMDVIYPANSGAALQPLGPDGNFTGFSNVLTFSGDHGTVVFTQMKLLENLPVMLTSPGIWEALGLPLTPFEDTINFFGDPGQVDEDSVRPYVKMQATLHEADCTGANCTPGAVVMDNGNPVVAFGTAPIDIPNCERCHSAFETPNSPNGDPLVDPDAMLVQQEIDFWNAYYSIDTSAGDSDWYSRLKGAAISILNIHDRDHGTDFIDNYPGSGALRPAACARGLVGQACTLHSDCDTLPGAGDGQCDIPQNTRIGHESVICQRCHADNVIAVVKSANCGPDNALGADPCATGSLIPPLTEAIHHNHRGMDEGGPITFNDTYGRTGGCQGCHPAHRSDGSLAAYPIDLDGNNTFAATDNRDAAGGCFVGRDVHSNPLRNVDGAETPSHLNPVGQYLVDNVASDSGTDKGIWCTNCHQQLSQELWKAEDMEDLTHQVGLINVREPGDANGDSIVDYQDVAFALGISNQQFVDWVDPRSPTGAGSNASANTTHAIWNPDPGLCDFLTNPGNPDQDAKVVTLEVAIPSGAACSTSDRIGPVDCSGAGGPVFDICGTYDSDPGGASASGDFSVNVLDFCTTTDCVGAAQTALNGIGGGFAVAVPFSAATDGRDHWLSPGEPHCADCHAAPYVEQSGNITFYPPFNYPRKASLNRYTKGHQGLTCQGCHESIHGLYPVTPTIDTTSYAQAAQWNKDGSHGPLKCAACHVANNVGVNMRVTGQDSIAYCAAGTNRGLACSSDADCGGVAGACVDLGTITDGDAQLDAAVTWAHYFTEDVGVLDTICQSCHDVQGNNWTGPDGISSANRAWTEHAWAGRVSRASMDQAELEILGHVAGDNSAGDDPVTGLCVTCHGNRTRMLERHGCRTRWKNHLLDGRASESVWEYVSTTYVTGEPAADGTVCGW